MHVVTSLQLEMVTPQSFQILKLHTQLAKAQAGEGLATGRLKKAEEANEVEKTLWFFCGQAV